MIHYRTLRDADKSALFSLGCLLFREEDEIPDLQKALASCVPELSYVAVEDKQIRGFALLCPPLTTIHDHCLVHKKGMELAFLAVHPSSQGKGIGSHLLKRVTSKGICWLVVDRVNNGARSLYERKGFYAVKDIENGPHPCTLMEYGAASQ